MQEMQIRSLGQEDTLEKEMATHCNILAWRIPWTEAPGRLQSIGLYGVGHECSNLAYMHTAQHLIRLSEGKQAPTWVREC